MNLRDLEYLVALAEHRHFGRAAEASYVSQPTLSTQLKKLEAELGVPLFERTSRAVLLTAAGETIVERARRVLAEVADMRALAARAADPRSGRIRLGIFPTLGPYLLPRAVTPLRETLPALEVLLVEEKTPELFARLHRGALDACVVALPVTDETLHVEALFREDFVLAVPAGHPLADGAMTLDRLDGEPLLLLEDGHCMRDQALAVCRRVGAAERDGFRATSLETLRLMVGAGVGVTLLPRLSVAPPSPVQRDVVLREFAEGTPYRDLAMVWRRSSIADPVLREVADVLRDVPADLVTALPALPD